MPAEIFFVSFHPCIMFSEVWFTYGLCAVLLMELSITHVLLYACMLLLLYTFLQVCRV